MSFAIGTDELSPSRLQAYMEKAQQAAIKRALKLSIVSSADELVFKEAAPGTDLSQPAGSGYTNEIYLTGAAVINTWTSVYDTALVPVLGQRQVAVFYKVFDLAAAPSATAVRFRLGPTGATTLAWFHFEGIVNVKLTPEAWFSEPVVYGPNESMFIEFFPSAAVAVGERLGFGCFIAEPAGQSIS